MFNFSDMLMGIPITPLMNVRINACDHAIAKHSITALAGIWVIQFVSLRQYCSMDFVRQISVQTSI
jgi:hypothetical protein